jgi:hypothetical protein
MKTVRLILGIFFVAGLGLFAGGLYSLQRTRQFLGTVVEAPGTVIDNVQRESPRSSRDVYWMFYPRFSFETSDGREIVVISKTGSSQPAYDEDEPVTVLYDPRQPDHASIKSFTDLWRHSVILGGMGALSWLLGIAAVVWEAVSHRRKTRLQRNGRRIKARIIRVELNLSVKVKGKHPFHIVCHWLDPAKNETHVFQSADIWFNPADYITGNTIEVLVDPNNPRRYVVDTTFLPKVV